LAQEKGTGENGATAWQGSKYDPAAALLEKNNERVLKLGSIALRVFYPLKK